MSIDWSKVESSPETKQKVEGKVLLDLRAKIVDLEQDLYRHGIMSDYDEAQFRQETPERGEKKPWQNSPSKWPIRLLP